jgi:hypothetical protein
MKPPIIIVAAGRSGTKLVRRLIGAHPSVCCFPREINYIWRHGNAGHPTDELQPEMATDRVAQYIRRRFRRFAASQGRDWLVEKTCANSLRVGFVRAVFPAARILHLIRDGRAVTESAMRCWQGRHSLGYLLEKARWVPWSDVPYYAMRYLGFQLGRIKSRERAQSSWGPRFSGMDEIVGKRPLLDVCAMQWLACVRAAREWFAAAPREDAITVRYEDIVADPVGAADKIYSWAGLDFLPECRRYAEGEVQSGHRDKWRDRLAPAQVDRVEELLGGYLTEIGYSV